MQRGQAPLILFPQGSIAVRHSACRVTSKNKNVALENQRDVTVAVGYSPRAGTFSFVRIWAATSDGS